jgi:hypothetical protein
MVGPVKDANKGDILAITFKQNGKYKNAIKIVNETADGSAPSTPTNSGSANVPVQNVVNAAPVDEKTDAAKLACKFYTDAKSAKIKDSDIPEAFVVALGMADMVKDWKESKGAFAPGANVDLPDADNLDDINED